jgi:hypothetical protein
MRAVLTVHGLAAGYAEVSIVLPVAVPGSRFPVAGCRWVSVGGVVWSCSAGDVVAGTLM